jgi:hypothetical protein
LTESQEDYFSKAFSTKQAKSLALFYRITTRLLQYKKCCLFTFMGLKNKYPLHETIFLQGCKLDNTQCWCPEPKVLEERVSSCKTFQVLQCTEKRGLCRVPLLIQKKRRTVHLLKINVIIVKKGFTSFTKRNPDQKWKNGNPFLFQTLGMDK